jgi:hypothetical protein
MAVSVYGRTLLKLLRTAFADQSVQGGRKDVTCFIFLTFSPYRCYSLSSLCTSHVNGHFYQPGWLCEK